MSYPHVLITGGSSGIGRALARQLAAAGYNISIVARRKDLLDDAAQEIKTHFVRNGQRVVAYSADVADAAQAESAVKAAMADLGIPDLVITSAGIAVPGYFEDVSLENFERTMDVNYFGSLYVVRAVLPAMRARKSGRIVFISSGAGLMGIFGYAPYAPPKFALRGLAEGLRAELRADKVAVSIAYPPDTETPMLVEENKTKPEETKLITSVVKAWTAEDVATCIMRGIARGKFSITPGIAIWAMSRMPGIALPVLHWYADFLAASVRKRRVRAAAKVAVPALQR
jgi:3-dehydrosphinganine reductase